jgi:hypothetical protein
MQRESRLGRVLWSVFLVLLGSYVVADFVRSPFSTSPGAAAVRPAAVRIWTPAAVGEEGGSVLEAAAAGLELSRHPTALRTISGGSTAALISFLSRPPGNGRMLAISSATLADLAYDRHETLVSGVAEEAVLARALLRRARPVAILAEDPIEVAVGRRSPINDGSALLASLAADPEGQLFGIADDTFSRDELATLVAGAGVDGEVRFTVLQSVGVEAIESGSARTLLAPRSVFRSDDAGRLRDLGWPLPGPPPCSWMALLAPPGTPAGQVRRLRSWMSTVLAEPGWRAKLRREGRHAAGPRVRELGRLIRDHGPAEALERTAEEVEHR